MTGTIRTITLTALLAAAATLTACSDQQEPPIELPPATASTPNLSPNVSATPTTTPQRQILDAYLGMQKAFAKAGEAADPDYPELSKYTSGAALKVLVDGLSNMRANGLRARGETVYRPRVESFQPADSPTKARVRDCVDTAKAQAYKANGDHYNDTPGGLRLVIADLERVDDGWKVTGLGVHKVGSCKL